MTYSKTTWVQNSPPYINATNLNKIEQGVADSQSVPTISDLLSVTGVSDGGLVRVQGYDSAGDGGGGPFRRHAAASDAVNSGTVFASADGGRWKRIIEGPINVKWFGAKGDFNGVTGAGTDDSSAFDAWSTYLAQQTVDWTVFGWNVYDRIRVQGYVPAGAYLITTANDAFISAPGSLSNGLSIHGDGREVTQVVYKPPAPGGSDTYLIANANPTGWLHMHLQDISFVGATSGASWMLSTGPNIQNYSFERVNWSDFKYGLRLQGTDNNSEFSFHHCHIYGTWTHFLWSETSEQFLNYSFFHTQFECQQGNYIRMTLGGNVNIYGGSIIQLNPPSTTTGTLFLLEGNSHGDGLLRFYCQGVRFELRGTNSRLINCEWNFGTVAFDSCQDDSYAFFESGSSTSPNTIRARFASTNVGMPLVKFTNCSLMGRHEYAYQDNSWIGHDYVLYDTCHIRNFERVADFVVYTQISATSNIGGKPVVKFRNCKTEQLANVRVVAADSDVGWHHSNTGVAERKYAMFKWGTGTGPGANMTLELLMPDRAVVTRVTIYWPAFGTSTSTAWTYTVQDSQGTPFQLAQAAGGGTAQLKNGFKVEQSTWHVCDTLNKSKLKLITNASVDATTADFLCVVEYLG